MITAPFNFVPLSDKVFFPTWADEVSHDVPFEDGESGEIDITITAQSPIFIRDHANKEKFCNHNGQYYIPGSSLKGMVRNVLEIMSYSKMNQVDDATFAVRDLSESTNFYMEQMKKEVYAGWLKRTEDGYVIEDCGTAYRIHHNEINKATGKPFAEKFRNEGFEKTSEYKYNLLGGTHLSIEVGEPYRSEKNPKYDKRIFCKYKKGGRKGTLVLTGQPTPRKNTGNRGDGKGFEFVFFEPQKELKVTEKVYKNFLAAYFDGRETQPHESPDWTFWKKGLQAGKKVPVFFQKENGKVIHFGLSLLYKLPYNHSIYDGIIEVHRSKEKDMAQTIFGYIDDKKALKGRVYFSHCVSTNAKPMQSRTENLGMPRASYYPIYVRQDGKNLFTTYMDGEFRIAGWKRYPIHKGSIVQTTKKNENEKVGTTFTPLAPGAVFHGKLRYHNLKKVELGAILSALTFHNTKGLYHNIGMAKSLGYGKITIDLHGVEEVETYLKEFEAQMHLSIPDWHDSEQLKQLFTMASEQDNRGNSLLRYMDLKAFAEHKTKNNKDYLRLYTELEGVKAIKPKSLVDEAFLEAMREKYMEMEKKNKERIEQEERERIFAEDYRRVEKSKDVQLLENFIKKYPESKEADLVQKSLEKLKATLQEDRHKKVNDNAQNAYDVLLKKKGKKGFEKDKKKFIDKWSAEKNNKKSPFVLELVEKVKKMK